MMPAQLYALNCVMTGEEPFRSAKKNMDDKPINQNNPWENPAPIDPLEPVIPNMAEDTAREAASQVVSDMDAALEDTSADLRKTGRDTRRVIEQQPLELEMPASSAPPALSAPAPAQYTGYATVPTKTNTMAIISLLAGLSSWVFLPIIGAIVGLITGFMSRDEIKKSAGAETGDGLAVAGIVISSLNLLLSLLCVCGFIAMLMFGMMLPNF